MYIKWGSFCRDQSYVDIVDLLANDWEVFEPREGYSDRVRGHRIENPLTDLPLMLGGEILTTSEIEAIIKPIEEEES